MFDEFAKDGLETADEFAERVHMIGQDVQNVQLRQMREAFSRPHIISPCARRSKRLMRVSSWSLKKYEGQ